MRTITLIVPLLAAACAAGEPSPLHGDHALSVHTLVMDGTDWDRGLEGYSGTVPFPAKTEATGLQYQHFFSGGSSMVFRLEQRSYAIDRKNADSGEGTEFGWLGRVYMNPDEALQFFAQAGLHFGPGLEWRGGTESSFYLGFDLGIGGAYFFEAGPFLEAMFGYDYTHINTPIPGAVEVQDTISGFVGTIGLGFAF